MSWVSESAYFADVPADYGPSTAGGPFVASRTSLGLIAKASAGIAGEGPVAGDDRSSRPPMLDLRERRKWETRDSELDLESGSELHSAVQPEALSTGSLTTNRTTK